MKDNLIAKKAVTLLEVIVYLGLFAVVFGVVTQFFFTTSSSNESTARRNEFEQVTIFLDEHLRSTFVTTVSVDEGNTIFDSSNGRLRSNITGGTIEYYIAGDRLMVNRNGTVNALTSSGYVVSNFLLERVEFSDNSLAGVKVSVDLDDNRNNVSKSFNTSYLIDY